MIEDPLLNVVVTRVALLTLNNNKGSGSGHVWLCWVVGVTTLSFCSFLAREVKMKCPKSDEFFCFTPRSIHCEHGFDSKIHSADTVWCVAHHPRFALVLNYVML